MLLDVQELIPSSVAANRGDVLSMPLLSCMHVLLKVEVVGVNQELANVAVAFKQGVEEELPTPISSLHSW